MSIKKNRKLYNSENEWMTGTFNKMDASQE